METQGTYAGDEAPARVLPPHPGAVPVGEKMLTVVGGFALRKIHISAARGWTGLPDVLSREELEEFAVQRRLAEEAEASAQAVLARARVEADAIVNRARQHARSLGDTQLKLWQEAFDARQAELVESLGEAVGVVVESVLKRVLASSEDLPVRMAMEMAMRALGLELRAAVVCHPMDLPLVQAQAGRLGVASIEPDPELQRGQVVFSSANGQVRVDTDHMLERLMHDLRSALSSRVRPSTP